VPIDGPISVNYHMYKPCNYRCQFCFATFADVEGALGLADQRALLRRLREAGCEKINFAGGEPTLYRGLGELLREARALGFVTSVITNGARLGALLQTHADTLDWVGLSVDSADEAVQARLGRGNGDHVARSRRLAVGVREAGIKLKLNTVVTALTWEEDMRTLVREMSPRRWKVFQVLPVGGQNDGAIAALRITEEQFARFAARHADLPPPLTPVVEDNEAMTGSYAMIDPLGRFFSNVAGYHVYSRPILEIGVASALQESRFMPHRLVRRGGVYAW
jgi:radical S-adenosyl methionine domain-containing protein 2